MRVRHLLGHTAGLPDFDGPITVEDLFDWPGVTARLAAQAPAWEPGTAGGYHSVTFGFLVGEVVRRVTGRSLGTFFAEEVAGPLGADFHIGLAAEHDHRVAPLIADPQGDKPPGFLVGVSDSRTEAWRRAEVPAINGFGNARSVAAVQSVLACEGVSGGVRLLSPAGAERVFEEQFHGEDRVLGAPMRYGLGFRVENRTCTWGGWGGSIVLADADHRLAVSYVMNQALWDDGYEPRARRRAGRLRSDHGLAFRREQARQEAQHQCRPHHVRQQRRLHPAGPAALHGEQRPHHRRCQYQRRVCGSPSSKGRTSRSPGGRRTRRTARRGRRLPPPRPSRARSPPPTASNRGGRGKARR